ncbi:MAG: hypothetical protein WDZ77_02040 [Candidatus Pacearchaeota archaeon]
MNHSRQNLTLGILRIGFGLVLLWAFFDKLLGLGFGTVRGNAWINGISPTKEFLQNETSGIFINFYYWLSNFAIIDWLFMLGLFGIGISLTFGIANKLGTYLGFTLFILMWAGNLPPTHHPFIEKQLIYAITLLVIFHFKGNEYLGFGKKWKNLKIVKNNKWLE